MTMKRPYRLAIMASGTGSNVRNILRYFETIEEVNVMLVGSNKAQAGALAIAEEFGVEKLIFDNEFITEEGINVRAHLQSSGIDCLVLAGFLRKIPDELIDMYQDRIVNIHPSLLPKYGGKGMYGIHVHKAVKAAQEEETGITIHLVNSEYDKGRILFQAKTAVETNDSPEQIQEKVKMLEAEYFPSTIHKFLKDGI